MDILPEEILHHILSYFVFTDPWQSMVPVSKKWREIVSFYAAQRRTEWEDYLASLKNRYTTYHNNETDLTIEARAKGLYDTYLEIAQIPEKFYQAKSFYTHLINYSTVYNIYNSLPLKYLVAFLIRHRLKGELAILTCSTLYQDSRDQNSHIAALAMRQLTYYTTHEWTSFFDEYVLQSMAQNLHSPNNDLIRQSSVLVNLSKLIHVDSIWDMAKDENIMHDVVPAHLIPSYAILTMEMKKARRIEVIEKYFSVNLLIDNYHTWNLWQRIVVLQLIARNIHSVIDSSEHMALIEFLMALINDMSADRVLIASNFGEFFAIVDVLGHFCTTPINEQLLGISLLMILTDTMVLFQYDFPHLTDMVHGFLEKLRKLMLFMKIDAATMDPEFIENFFPLWCDDSAVKNRKLWFVKYLACQQNFTTVNLEIQQLLQYEENSTTKRLA